MACVSISARQDQASRKEELMSKKLGVTIVVIVATCAVPAHVQAASDADVTCSPGVLCAESTVITEHNVGNIRFHVGSTTVGECTVGDLRGTLTAVSSSGFEGNIETTALSGTGTGGECTGSFGDFTFIGNVGNGTPWCMRALATMNADEIQIRGNSCSLSSRSITFILNSTTAKECKYNRVPAVVGSYSTNDSDAKISFTNAAFSLESGGILCPSTVEVDMSMTLEKATTPQTTDPLNIS